MKKIFFSAVLLSFVSVLGEDSLKEPEKPSLFTQNRKLSFSSSYLDWANSNRAIGEFMGEVMDIYGFVYEGLERVLGLEVGPATFLYDAFWNADFIISFVIPSWKGVLNDHINTTYHEFGHFSRSRAHGGKPKFNLPNDTYDSFFSFFKGYFNGKPSDDSVVRASVSPNITFSKNDELLFYAAGLNNQTALAEHMSDKAYFQGIHPFTLGMYWRAKLSTLSYINSFGGKRIDLDNPADRDESIPQKDVDGDDVISILSVYRDLNRNVKAADIEYATKMAFFTSGSLYAYLWSIAKIQSDRAYKMKPFELWGIRAPDTSAYWMPQGISYKITSGYRYDQTWVFPVAFEFVQKGDTAYEVTLGAHKTFSQWNNSSVRADVIISDQGEMGGKVYIEYSPFDYTYIGFGVESYNPKTLHGARNTPKNEARSNEFWVQVGLKY
jgi:hypothetical protein